MNFFDLPYITIHNESGLLFYILTHVFLAYAGYLLGKDDKDGKRNNGTSKKD